MAYTLTQLRTELTTDPLTLGYAALTDATLAAAVLNDATKARPYVSHEVMALDILGTLSIAEMAAAPLSATASWFFQLFIIALSQSSGDPTTARYVAVCNAIFPVATYPTTNAALVALKNRTGSRAFELWGDGTLVAANDIISARKGSS